MSIFHQVAAWLSRTMIKSMLLLLLLVSVAHGADENAEGVGFRTVLTMALEQHPSIFGKQSGIKVAETQIDIAQWSYWPTPSISHRITESLGDGQVTNISESVISLEQPLWQGGALDAELAAAKAFKKEAEASLQTSRMEVTLQTINAFGEAFAAKKTLEAKQRNVELLQKLYDQIRRRSESGLSPLSDVRLAEGRIKTAESGLLSTQTAFQNAKEELYALTSNNFPIDFDSFENNQLQWNNLPTDIKKAVAMSPETAEIREQVAKLRWQAKKTQASAWPKLSLVVSQTHNNSPSSGDSVAFLNFESDWKSGLSVVSRGSEAELQVLAKINEIDFQLRQVEKDVRSDYLQHASSKENIVTLQDALGASSSIFESWNRQFRAGRKSWQEVMDSAKEQESIEGMLANAVSAGSTTSWRLAARVNGVDWLLREQ